MFKNGPHDPVLRGAARQGIRSHHGSYYMWQKFERFLRFNATIVQNAEMKKTYYSQGSKKTLTQQQCSHIFKFDILHKSWKAIHLSTCNNLSLAVCTSQASDQLVLKLKWSLSNKVRINPCVTPRKSIKMGKKLAFLPVAERPLSLSIARSFSTVKLCSSVCSSKDSLTSVSWIMRKMI